MLRRHPLTSLPQLAPSRARGHRVLLVEDDPTAAEMLAELVMAFGDDPRVVGTVDDALAAIAEEEFCYALVDQELPSRPGAKPLASGGERIMQAPRAKDNRRNAEGFHVTPIIVVTGFSGDNEFVSSMYDAGADAFFLKPITPRITTLRDRIRAVLTRAKRTEHGACAAFALAGSVAPRAVGGDAVAPAVKGGGTVRIALDGVARGGRTSFLANGERRDLQDAKFGVLLRFVVAHQASPGAMTPKALLGLSRSRDATTRVREAFKGLLPEGFELIEGDRRGQFRLNPAVVIERVDWEALAKHPDAVVQKLALEQLRKAKRGERG